MTGLVPGALRPDASPCDQEPIHTPGTIQSHGVLLAARADDLRVTHVSANLQSATGAEVGATLGRRLADVLGGDAVSAILASLGAEGYRPANVLSLHLPLSLAPHRNLLAHRHQGRLIVELESVSATEDHELALSRAQGIIAGLHRAATVQDLCEFAAREIRLLTGYGRVMVYRFAPDGHGRVVAEERHPALEPYLGLHYPASDIPAQARRIYVLQRVRAIADIDHLPVPILVDPALSGAAELDMTLCALRAVSPVHLEYLHNMQVRATLAISLLRDNELWGMIVCHHGSPRAAPADMRALCDVIGQIMSLLIANVSETERLTGNLDRQRRIAALRDQIESAGSITAGLVRNGTALLDLVGATGALVRFGGRSASMGTVPVPGDVNAIVAALRTASADPVVADDEIGGDRRFAHLGPVAGGTLLMAIANNPDNYVTWFRPEVARTIAWGGDPTKAVDRDPETGHFSPRKSFAIWREQVRGRSLPWSDEDVQTARDLRRSITGALLRQAETELAKLSAYDPLTGLANRRTLEMRIEMWRASEPRPAAALLFFDLDRFKSVNDALGHAAGDEILIQTAQRAKALVPPHVLVSRLGGDEFVVFWADAEPDQVARLAQDILSIFGRPFSLLGRSHRASASIGIAMSDAIGGSGDLMREADAAMYAAKRQGGGQFVVFERALHETVLKNLETEQDLFLAVERNELRLQFQPIVGTPARALRGFEALVRWHHPERGWISPAEFIPPAEENGLINAIGDFVLRHALAQLKTWQAVAPALTMAVNVSARQLTEGGFSTILAACLAEYAVPAATLCIEVTEGVLMQEAAVRELVRVRALGARVALDDFGTGFSSLSYLQSLPVDIVKIDRSFLTRLGADAKASRFFRAIVGLAHTLDLTVVAEGCETEVQWEALVEAGCDAVQGWLTGRPMDAEMAGGRVTA